MNRILAAILVLVAGAVGTLLVPFDGSAQSQPVAQSSEPVLVELFTSQGCSSCPPADRLAARLAREPQLVVISRPVTYWDRLGWKDTLAREANTELQRAYASYGLGNYNGVYTPQSVIAGRFGEVGSREASIRRLVARAAGSRDAVIRVRGDATRGFAIGIAGNTAGTAELALLGVASHSEVAIGRGENRGRTIGYTNVLVDERRVANWSGGQTSLVVEPDALDMPGADRYALVLRESGGGPVLAAHWLN